MTERHRFYGDLAPWWPLISAPEEYAEEAAFAASLLRITTSTPPGQRPTVLAVLVPDDIVENFVPSTDCGGHDAPDGRGVRYLSWTTDPDPTDSTSTTEYAFLLRDAEGRCR